MYHCDECGVGTPDSHRPTCSKSPEGKKYWEDEALGALIKLSQAKELMLSVANTFDELGLHDRAQAVREARWKLVDEAK